MNLEHLFQDAEDTLALVRGDEELGDIREGRIAVIEFAFPLDGSVGLLLDHVPLVDAEDYAFAEFNRFLHNFDVLRDHVVSGIGEDHGHVALFERTTRTDGGVKLDGFADLATPPQAGGVNQRQLLLIVGDDGVNRVARGAGNFGHEMARLAQDSVDKRRFADIRTPDDRDERPRATQLLPTPLFREQFNHSVEDIGEAAAIGGAHRHGVAERQLIERADFDFLLLVVHLVDNENRGAPAALEHAGDFDVAIGGSGLAVIDEDDQITFIEGKFHLLANGGIEQIRRTGNPAAGVHDVEGASLPIHFAEMTITRHAGFGRGDRLFRAGGAVEDRGLANVGAADDGDEGKAHEVNSKLET